MSASILRTAKFTAWSCSAEGTAATGHAATILAVLGLSEFAEKGSNVVTDVADDNAIITAILRNAGSDYLLGDSSSLPEIKQFMSLARSLTTADLQYVDARLATRTYLVGQSFTVADAAVFVAIRVQCVDEVGGYANLARWFDQVQHVVRRGVFERITLVVTAKPAAAVAAVAAAAPAGAGAAAGAGKGKGKEASGQPPAAAAGGAATGEKQEKKKEEKKKETKSSAPAAEATAAADDEKLDPSQLDIRVGHVVKCWNHPDSDKLLCEEIDLGEASVRTIASGIRPHYQAEDLQGRKVCVLANLKDRNLAGFKSQGMVLCAVSKDHSAIKLVEPPAGAAAGDRITFPGFTGEPASASAVAKKKILEKLGPQVCTCMRRVLLCFITCIVSRIAVYLE